MIELIFIVYLISWVFLYLEWGTIQEFGVEMKLFFMGKGIDPHDIDNEGWDEEVNNGFEDLLNSYGWWFFYLLLFFILINMPFVLLKGLSKKD